MVDQDSKLQMKLSESKFPFSKRMLNFFQQTELRTIGDLAAIPLDKFTCFKGFKSKCVQELICFINYEKIANLFTGFKKWKEENYVC